MTFKTHALRLATATASCDCCFMESRCWPGTEPHSGDVIVKREPTLLPANVLYLVRSGAITAVALIETMLCKLPWPPPAGDAALQGRLLRRARVQLRQRARATRLADPDASECSFLQEIATRIGREERVGEHVWIRQRLPMSRLEIGRYLGYAAETACRSMRRLQSNGELEVSRRTLLLKKCLAATASGAATGAAASTGRSATLSA